MNLRKERLHIIIHSPEHSTAVQKRLFELGFRWSMGNKIHAAESPSLQVNYCGPDGIITHASTKEWTPLKPHTVVTLDDLYSDKFTVPKSVTIALNSEYKATVEPDGITVGCQTFPLSVIDELVKARAEVLS